MGKNKRPSGLAEITTSELLPGDILLYNGKKLVSKLIRCFDQSYVNHAAVFIGKDEKTGEPQVIEAVGEGVLQRSLAESFDHSNYIVVKRYEEVSDTIGPVLDEAKRYFREEHRYEFEGIFFLAIISLVEWVHFNPTVAWTVSRTLKKHFSRYLKDTKKQPVTCSELVYRCYSEAERADGSNYSFLVDERPMFRSVMATGSESSVTDQRNLVSKALKAGGKEGLKSAGEMSNEESEEVIENMYRFTCDNMIKSSPASPAVDENNRLSKVCGIIPHFVTPGDIFKSKSLTNIGIVELKRKK